MKKTVSILIILNILILSLFIYSFTHLNDFKQFARNVIESSIDKKVNDYVISDSILRQMTQVKIIEEKEQQKIDEDELNWINLSIYKESRGESDAGKIAVGQVVLNRKNSGIFPNTILNVLSDKNQFPWWEKNKKLIENIDEWNRCRYIAYCLLNNEITVDITEGALFFHSVNTKPKWIKEKQKICQIDKHIFYK